MPLPTDDLLGLQWHLGNSNGRLDLNVRSVWNPGQGTAYTGAGVRAVVIDDGFDYGHPDLAPSYLPALDYDFRANPDDNDPVAESGDNHGTAVMGLIGADDNGSGAVGVAFDTQLVGIRALNEFEIASAITRAAVEASGDVANLSLALLNTQWKNISDRIPTAIDTAIATGRGGLGMTVVVAAGNDRGFWHNTNADEWKSDTNQVVVAAVDQDGLIAGYSTPGASILVSGFGSYSDVVTTDRRGNDGVPGDFTHFFDGTSAAAPMVAGVVALMYDASPSLGWRDVQHILANSARHVGSAVGAATIGAEQATNGASTWTWNGARTWNGGGLHYSNDYGFGLVDAHAAVRLAETWLLGPKGLTGLFTGIAPQASRNQAGIVLDLLDATATIADGTSLHLTSQVAVDQEVERVSVRITFVTAQSSDLGVWLTSPSGTVSELIDASVIGRSLDGLTWTFETQAFRGERAGGGWTLRIADEAPGNALTISDAVVAVLGRGSDLPRVRQFNVAGDRYVFTDEYSDYAGSAGHRTALTDDNGGNDTINAAAVTTGSLIALDGTGSRIDGVALTIANSIENAIGGDGGDTITGNGSTNRLYGMRGADVIRGGAGTDSLFGGEGDDYVYFDPTDNLDEVLGQAGFDTLIVQNGVSPQGFDLTAHEFERGRIDFVDTTSQPWSFAHQFLLPGWVVDYNDTHYDNGTRQVQVFDTGPADPWSSYIDYYRLDGGPLEARRTINDNGTFSTTFFDLTGQPWSRYTDYNYGPANELVARQVLFDNGSFTNTYFDALNQNPWQQYTDYYDSAGVFVGRTVVYDDGRLF